MNRRDFIKGAIPAAAATWTVTCKYEEPKQDSEEEARANWGYRVYCYEREQGEWCFSENTRGSFSHEKEHLNNGEPDPYGGWMKGGKLHFRTLEDAKGFVDDHVRVKDDTNLIDSIYDIYYLNKDDLDYESCQPKEIHVAHYWFNGDTGRTITWHSDAHNEAKNG